MRASPRYALLKSRHESSAPLSGERFVESIIGVTTFRITSEIAIITIFANRTQIRQKCARINQARHLQDPLRGRKIKDMQPASHKQILEVVIGWHRKYRNEFHVFERRGSNHETLFCRPSITNAVPTVCLLKCLSHSFVRCWNIRPTAKNRQRDSLCIC